MTIFQAINDRHMAAHLLFNKAKDEARGVLAAFADKPAAARTVARTHFGTMAIAWRVHLAAASAPRWVLVERPGRGPEYGQQVREELRDGKALVLFADGANAWCFTMTPPVPL